VTEKDCRERVSTDNPPTRYRHLLRELFHADGRKLSVMKPYQQCDWRCAKRFQSI